MLPSDSTGLPLELTKIEGGSSDGINPTPDDDCADSENMYKLVSLNEMRRLSSLGPQADKISLPRVKRLTMKEARLNGHSLLL